ncbi:MAG: hypothetical protein KY476_25060 [Planctomycetes bacterium]|nr:hypothetical protein [Planctomycetota bacterium]
MILLFADTTSLLDRAAGALGITRESLDNALWLTLLAGLVLSALHLLTMLVTRWGDRNASSKALIFSFLLHLSCAAGWVAFTPPERPAQPPELPPSFQVQELRDESDRPVEDRRDGNTPVWEQPPAPADTQLARAEQRLPELKPPESPERLPEELTRPEVDLPDLPTRPDEPVSTPQPERDGRPDPLVEASIPSRLDNPEVLLRSQVDVPQPDRRREPVPRRDVIDTTVDRRPTQGAVDRVQPEFDDSRQLSSLDADVDARAFLKRGQVGPVIESRGGPAPAALDANAAGAPSGETSPQPPAGIAAAGRQRQIPTRTSASRIDGAVERLRPTETPSAPDATGDTRLAVREGVAVDIPRGGAAPNVVRPNFPVGRVSPTPSVPPTYQLRGLEGRRDIALRHGGTDESEKAVDRALEWLARNQHPDGYWDADAHGAGNAQLDADGRDSRGAIPRDGATGAKSDAGLTALSVLAFLGAGHTHEVGPYTDNVRRALGWLVARQVRGGEEHGFLGADATYYARIYCHAMATYALAEAYGMQKDPTRNPWLREPLELAVEYSVKRQNADGGWRYRTDSVDSKSDMSIFGWQLMALKSAQIAGVQVPRSAEDKMVKFLVERSLGTNKGLAAYGAYGDATPSASMTAEALFSKQMLGLPRDHVQSTEAVNFLLGSLPKRSEYNLYYWYYGTLATFHYGGRSWQRWNESMRELLVADQRKDGEAAGSWDPFCRYGEYGGRVYSTALSALCLEVYYRFLPLYRHADEEATR